LAVIRKFRFETEIYRTLERIPLGVRRKCDRVGIKLALEEWLALGIGERLALCHLPAESAEEQEAFDIFTREAVRCHCGAEPARLAEEKRALAEPPSEPPAQLIAHARAEGFSLGRAQWERLDDDQRYALVKLGAGAKPSHDLRAALEEFLAPR
jgi:hypothetical protein